jgi:hypothetical protein
MITNKCLQETGKCHADWADRMRGRREKQNQWGHLTQCPLHWKGVLLRDTWQRGHTVHQPPSEDFKMRQEWKSPCELASLDLLFWLSALPYRPWLLSALQKHSYKACAYSAENRGVHPQNTDPPFALCPAQDNLVLKPFFHNWGSAVLEYPLVTQVKKQENWLP